MDKKYIELFKELAQATATSAETVMDYDRQHDDIKGLETATIMRDDYQDLTEQIVQANDEYILTKHDATKLLVSAMIMVNQLQDRMNNLKKAMTGYQADVIPKLQLVIDCEDDEAAKKIANEEFVIKDKE